METEDSIRLTMKGKGENPVVQLPRRKLRWLQVLRLFIGIFLCFYALSRFLPCTPIKAYPRADSMSMVDHGWSQAMHLSFLEHLQFGKDLVFTYGPWGFLARGYHPQTFILAMVSWTILTIIFLVAGWRLALFLSKNQVVAGLWLLGFIAAASLPVGEDFNCRLVALSMMLLFLHFFVEEGSITPIQAMLVVSLSWMSLIKFTALVQSGLLVSIIATDNIFRQRRFPWIIPLWVSSFLSFWFAAGQHLSGLVPFVCNSWQITSGYTEAMTLAGKTEAADLVYFLTIALLLCMLTGLLGWSRHRLFGALPLAGVGMILFAAFKLGFVRNDWQHEAPSEMALALVSLACLAVAGQVRPRIAVMTMCLTVIAVLAASSVFKLRFPGNGLRRQFVQTFSFDCLAAPITAPTTGYLQNYYEMIRFRDWKRCSLPPIEGSVDLYSYDQSVLFAHGLRYQPRPVLQSYSAYTPELEEMNAAHLQSDSAASNILFAIQPFDRRYPSLDDGLSWPELLTRYDLAGVSGGEDRFLILSRTAIPRQFHLVPLGREMMLPGQTVQVPTVTNGPVWVEMDIKKTPMGKLLSTLFKPPVLMLNVTLRDHEERSFRLVPGMARCGFLLSPLIADNRSFVALAAGGWHEDLARMDVKSMSISACFSTGATGCYQVPMAVRFYRLDFPPQNFKKSEAVSCLKN